MVLAHLADVEVKGFVSRFRAIAGDENPLLPAYDQLALFRSATKFAGMAELDNFERQRRETLAWLTSLPPSVGPRTGRHEELGPLTFDGAKRIRVSRSEPHPPDHRTVSLSHFSQR
jgi:hypothetical protein